MKDFLESKLMPIASKLAGIKFLIAIRDGITLAMPLIIIGSLFLVIASFPIPGWEAWLGDIGVSGYLWKGVDSSFGLMGLVAAFGIARSFSNQHGADGVSSGIISVSSFIMVTPFVSGETGSGITMGLMGASGIFVAIIVALFSAAIFNWFVANNIQIKMPDGVPPAVTQSFAALLPGAAIITLWLIVYGVLDAFGLPNMHQIMQTILGGPLSLLGSNIFGTMIVVGLNSLFWFVGLHGGNTINQLFSPTWLANLDANVAARQAGEALPHIITSPFMDNFVYIGGGGATLGLVIVVAMIARRKNASKRSKIMAPLTLTPGLFNINEPTMFGLPVVLNITLLLPFILAPMVNALIAYTAMASGLVPITYVAASWTMPPIISGFLATGSIMGSLLQVVIIIVDILLYLPFYSTLEKIFLKDEQAELG